MGTVERNVTKPPNEDLGQLSQRLSFRPAPGMSETHPPNAMLRDGDPGGSANLARSASPVAGPDFRFNVDGAQMGQPQSATEPGKGAVPIRPFQDSGQPSKVGLPISEMARAK